MMMNIIKSSSSCQQQPPQHQHDQIEQKCWPKPRQKCRIKYVRLKLFDSIINIQHHHCHQKYFPMDDDIQFNKSLAVCLFDKFFDNNNNSNSSNNHSTATFNHRSSKQSSIMNLFIRMWPTIFLHHILYVQLLLTLLGKCCANKKKIKFLNKKFLKMKFYFHKKN